MKVLYQWVDNDVALAEVCKKLQQQTAIAVDTEFVRSSTYYPHVGLLQIASEQNIYLIDPLAIANKQPLAELFENADVVKVLHACSEDLEVFRHFLGIFPQSLFDTQIAAAFAGYGLSIGYANLLKEIKQIDIPKQETRSDWLQRPLSDAQLRYAALDVEYLLEIYDVLTHQLKDQGSLSWVQADSEALIDKLRASNHQRDYYLRVSSAWKLKPQQLAVLKALCAWREQVAQKQDVPRGRVFKDPVLFEMALHLPKKQEHFLRIKNMSGAAVQEYGAELLELIQQRINADENYPAPLPRPLSAQQRQLVKQLKVQAQVVAESISLPVELLLRKKEYEFLARLPDTAEPYQLPTALSDWRKNIIGDNLINYLSSLGDV